MNALLNLLLECPERFVVSEIPCCLLGVFNWLASDQTAHTPDAELFPLR